MKSIFTKLVFTVLICLTSLTNGLSQLYEWRGPGRSGIYNESGLLKAWPANGPCITMGSREYG